MSPTLFPRPVLVARAAPVRKRVPTEKQLARAIADAARATFTALFQEHPGAYYYVTLVTDGLANRPCVSAWSREALAAAARPDLPAEMIEWSYADSPYCLYRDDLFAEVEALFLARPDRSRPGEYDLRLRAMETAMATLDREGLFGVGAARLRTVVVVEVMPPDYTNAERARRLNPPEAIREWLEGVAEPPR